MDGMKEIKMEVEEEEFVEEPVISREEMTVMDIALAYLKELRCTAELALGLAAKVPEVECLWIPTTDREVITLRRLLAEAREARRAQEAPVAPVAPEPKKKGPGPQKKRGRGRKAKPAAKKQAGYTCPTCSRQAKSGTCLCNGCQEWFHLKCVGIRSAEWTEEFRCPECSE